MIQIGFCDDDLSILSELRVLLDRYRVERDERGNCLRSLSESPGAADRD